MRDADTAAPTAMTLNDGESLLVVVDVRPSAGNMVSWWAGRLQPRFNMSASPGGMAAVVGHVHVDAGTLQRLSFLHRGLAGDRRPP
jgi:hypothetical protein